MSWISAKIVNYYAALRISASVVSVILPDRSENEHVPLVRMSDMQVRGGFDRREIVYPGGTPHVVTLVAAPPALDCTRSTVMN